MEPHLELIAAIYEGRAADAERLAHQLHAERNGARQERDAERALADRLAEALRFANFDFAPEEGCQAEADDALRAHETARATPGAAGQADLWVDVIPKPRCTCAKGWYAGGSTPLPPDAPHAPGCPARGAEGAP